VSKNCDGEICCLQRATKPKGAPGKTQVLPEHKGVIVKIVCNIIAVSVFVLSAGIPARAYETAMEYQFATAPAAHTQHQARTRARAAIRANAYMPANRSANTPTGVDHGIRGQ
jgi:hypothetical protein